MAIARMITDFSQQQENYGAAVGQSLIQLGQRVREQLATREYQRQAQAALPALQQAYSSALDKIEAGNVTDGYRDMMNARFQFGATQNPFLERIVGDAEKTALAASEAYMKQYQAQMQYGGRGGGRGGTTTGTGATLPAITPQESATQAMGMGRGGQPPTGIDFNKPPEDIVSTGLSPDEEAAANLPTTQTPEVLSEGQISKFIESVAESAKTKEFRDALRKAKEFPSSVKTRDDLMKYVNAYNGLSQAQQDEQQALFTNTFASTEEMRRSLPEKSGFTELAEAESIIGPGIKGIVFKEAVIPTGARVSESGATSASFATNRDQIETQRNLLTGAIVELSKGKIGKFFKESGGIYRVDISRDEDDQPILQDKNNPERTLVIPEDDYNAINSSFTTIKKIIPQFQHLKDAGGQAAFVSVRTGPTREATAQPTPAAPAAGKAAPAPAAPTPAPTPVAETAGLEKMLGELTATETAQTKQQRTKEIEKINKEIAALSGTERAVAAPSVMGAKGAEARRPKTKKEIENAIVRIKELVAKRDALTAINEGRAPAAAQQTQFVEGKIYKQGNKRYRYTNGEFVEIQ